MPDQSMIERMARALCDNQESHELNWEAWAHAARAVLREMREPTEAVLTRLEKVVEEDQGMSYRESWAGLIDAALEDGRKT